MPPPAADAPKPPLRERLRGSFAHTGATLALVWRSSAAGTVALAALTVVAAALAPASAYVGKLIVDGVVGARSAAPGPARDLASSHAVGYVLLELAVVAAMAFIERALGLLRQIVGARLGVDVN